MHLSDKYILVTKAEEPVTEGFQAVAVEDTSIYKGKVVRIPEMPVFIGNHKVAVGDVVIFAKYSPDTHPLKIDGVDHKYIFTGDLLDVDAVDQS